MDLGGILLPVLALTLGVATSVYFTVLWWQCRGSSEHAKGLLFWAIGLFLMFWFQVPAILIGFGKTITVTDFNFFFALTFPITFLALILFYFGILRISWVSLSMKSKNLFFGWLGLAIFFFSYQFIVNKGIISTYLLPLGGNILFYLPVRLIIVFAVIKLLSQPGIRTPSGIFGVICILGEMALGAARNIFVIKNVLRYPPQFWYIVLSGSKFFFTTQTLSVILLTLGFFFLHRAFHRQLKSI